MICADCEKKLIPESEFICEREGKTLCLGCDIKRQWGDKPALKPLLSRCCAADIEMVSNNKKILENIKWFMQCTKCGLLCETAAAELEHG